MKTKEPEKIFTRLLRFGIEKGVNGFTKEELDEWAIIQPEIKTISSNAFRNLQLLAKECFDISQKMPSSLDLYVLKTEYYFRNIELEELQLARDAAKSAKKYSLVAFSISFLAIFISLGTAIYQSNSPIHISESQMTVIKNLQQTELDNIQSSMEKIDLKLIETNNILDTLNATLAKRPKSEGQIDEGGE